MTVLMSDLRNWLRFTEAHLLSHVCLLKLRRPHLLQVWMPLRAQCLPGPTTTGAKPATAAGVRIAGTYTKCSRCSPIFEKLASLTGRPGTTWLCYNSSSLITFLLALE